MAFEEKTWLNRISEYPNRRTISGKTVNDTITVTRAEGVVSQEGDAFNAENMNDLENRIAQTFGNCSFVVENYRPYVIYENAQGEEVKKELGSIDLSTPLATQSQVLSGYSYGTKDAEDNLVAQTGTMENQGAYNVSVTPTDADQSITIPRGYHNGTGAVTVNKVALSGDAAENQVLSGKTFYTTNLTKKTGSMKNYSATSNAVNYASPYVRIANGAYINNSNAGYPQINISGLFQDKTVTPSQSAQTISADAGSILRNVTVAKIPTVTKAISGKTTYFQQTSDFYAGTMQFSPVYPIRPTSIRIVSGQNNARSEVVTWTPVIEGLRENTSTWDTLATGQSYTIPATTGYQALDWTVTPSIPSGYTGYYSMFRLNFTDRARMRRDSYVVLGGVIAI